MTIQTDAGVARKIVDQNPFTIGRTIDSAIAFVEPNVSRAHLLVRNKGGTIYIEDQGSVNGTFVNGARLEARRSTPVEPTDSIRLGKTNIAVSLMVIERAFSEHALNESELDSEQKDAIVNLIQGAHAEAHRLVRLGKDLHDNMANQAETRVAKLESHLVEEREAVLAQAHQKGQQIITAAEEKAKKEVVSIHVRANEARQKAEEYRQQLMSQAQSEIEALHNQHRERCQEMIDEAQEQISKLQELSKVEALNLKRRGEREAEVIIQEAHLEGEKQLQEILESAKADALKSMEEMASLARDQAEKEREQMIAEAEEQVNSLRLERKRQETEMSLQLKRLKTEIESATSELADHKKLLAQQKRVAADEIAYQKELAEKELKAQQQANEKALANLTEQKRQEVEKLKALKEEETLVFIQAKTLEFEKLKRQTEVELKNLDEKIRVLKPQVESLSTDLGQLQKKEAAAKSNVETLRAEKARLTEEIDQGKRSKVEYQTSAKDLESAVGRLSLEKQAVENSLRDLKADSQAQIAAHKSKLDDEFSRLRRVQQDELDMLRLNELERLKREREQVFEEMAREKERIGSEIMASVIQELANPGKSAQDASLTGELQQKIVNILEERSVSLITSAKGEQSVGEKIKTKRQRERRVWLAQGLAIGAVCLYVTQWAVVRFNEDKNPMKTAAEERARAAQEDLIRRKFNPPQNDELRSTYADCVIYTKDFVDIYLGPDFQKKWLKNASSYLLKQWRIEEDKSIEVLSAVNSLITTLKEKKENIHPDFVQDGLKKMNDLEAETVTRLKDILGSQVRYEAFRRHEKRFYTGYLQDRQPAAKKPLVEEEPPLEEIDGEE